MTFKDILVNFGRHSLSSCFIFGINCPIDSQLKFLISTILFRVQQKKRQVKQKCKKTTTKLTKTCV